MNKHEWRDRTDDGELRKVRATHHGGNWRMQVRLASDDGWNDLDPAPSADLSVLLDVLEGKYKRNRVPHHQLQQVQLLLARAVRVEAAGPKAPSGYDRPPKRGKPGSRG
ncbi:MAG: hypothetical protein ACI9EF_002567 [Pseudohongiellaceae bacterium]